jgi:hypothetical protein
MKLGLAGEFCEVFISAKSAAVVDHEQKIEMGRRVREFA